MKKVFWGLLITSIFFGCNRVPVRELTSTFKVQVQELRQQGKAVKVDILWVVDDSPSMCQEQASLAVSFHKFMQILKEAGNIDAHIAVTTTNMCKKGSPGAVRGKFVYRPASSFPPACIQTQIKECYQDKDCSSGWSCKGSVPARDMYICDNPKQKPKDQQVLVTVNPRSYCVRRCDRETDPLNCVEEFGVSQSCDDLCKNGPCKVEECVAKGLGTEAECAKVCSITNTCQEKCQMFFKDAAKCKTLCNKPADQCFTSCAGAYDDRRKWQAGIFNKEDVACGVICKADPTCDDLCAAQFGGRRVKCVYPGGDKKEAGCMKYPETSVCPKSLGSKYNILDNALAEKWFKAWKQGKWAGDPGWKDLSDKDVKAKIFEQLFKCMATVGATQYPCANQEMGLKAAFQALNPNGENGAQARAFLREDAYLLVVIVSDEDDCSTDKLLSGNDAVRCACLRDKNGCPDQPDAECNPSKPGPLIPVTQIVSSLKHLKKDPAMVLFATITGEPIPNSDVTPKSDFKETIDRYYGCKCAYGRNSTANYICKSAQGVSDFGSRYVLAAQCFGRTFGVVSNICSDTGLEDALSDIIRQFSPLFARICLPRPLDIHDDLVVTRIDKNGKRIVATKVKECTRDVMDRNHYTLVKNSPGCQALSTTDYPRIANAVAFCKPLDPSDNVEFRYRAFSLGSSRDAFVGNEDLPNTGTDLSGQ